MTRLAPQAFAKSIVQTVFAGLALAPTLAQARDVRIVGGQAESRFPAVGALVINGDWFCSGTLIAPRLVLTAGHCVEGMEGSEIELYFGPDANRLETGRRVRSTGAYMHPNYPSDDRNDIGVVVLAEDPGLTPIPARLDPVTQDIVGKTATFVGFGLYSQGGDGGERRSVDIAINELNDFFVGYATPGLNTCNGDSGGPALMDLGRGLEVIGVTSWGDAGCTDFGYNTRSDVFADWISDFIAGEVPTGPTGGSGGSQPGDDQSGDDGDDGQFQGDICSELDWYNDGYCDTECANPDPDCAGGDTTGGDDSWGGDDQSDDDGSWSDDDQSDDDESDDGSWGGDDQSSDDESDDDVGFDFSEVDLGKGCGAAPGALGLMLGGLGLLLFRATRRRA
jgi:hypothetical protein